MTTIPQDVIDAAQAGMKATKIPASVTIAQWALESGFGAHMPPNSNNPFGIKTMGGYPSVVVGTTEYAHGKVQHIPQAFAVFPSLAEAFTVHDQLLATSHFYANARSKLPDAEAFAQALTGVYATDPNYGNLLISLMRQHQLEQYNVAA